MMIKSFCFSLLAGLMLFTPSLASDEITAKTFVYKKTKEADLTVKAFFPADWKATDKRPSIVFFFGGGWTSGSPKQFEPQSEHFAKRGMVALCADYRVKSRHGVLPDACVEDAKSAVRWMRENASTLGIDPEKIVSSGGSAGGHLAACTGICPGLDHPDENQSVSSVPNLLVLYNPALNFNNARMNARINNDEKLAKALSPTIHLKKNSPPALLLFGTSDALLKQGEEFMEKSHEIGHSAELYTAEGEKHGFFNRPPWLGKTTKRVDDFLVSQGILEKAAP